MFCLFFYDFFVCCIILDDYFLDSLMFIRASNKVDHENYRNLLWTTMNLFPEICEAKHRDVISIYLPFIQ